MIGRFLLFNQGFTDGITNLIGGIAYDLFYPLFYIIDGIQSIFYAFAGIGNVRVGTDDIYNYGPTGPNKGMADTENGIVYYMLRNKTLQNILFSLAILAVFLLIIFTIMAFIKNMYSAKQKKWQDIISSTIKGAISFVFIPVCCLLGAIAGNVLLRVLNDATSTSSDTSISHQLFVASAYNANIFRTDKWTETDVANLREDYADYLKYLRTQETGESGSSSQDENLGTTIQSGKDGEYYAQFVDVMFKNKSYRSLSRYGSSDNDGMSEYYNYWDLNFFLLATSCVFMLFALIKVTFGMIKRLFMLMLLYVVSPVICSLYPLDDGAAVGSWKKSFISNFFSAYGAVVGMNIFYLLVPVLTNVQLTDGAGAIGFLGIVPLMITISSLYMVTDFVSLASSFMMGGGNALSEGMGLAGNVKKRMLQGTAKVGNRGKKVVGAFSKGIGNAVERRNEIKEANEKAGLKTKADYKGNEAEWKQYKKDHAEDFKKVKEDLGGGGARAFGGSMLSSIGHGALHLLGDTVESIGSAAGFGKTSNLLKDVKENKGQGTDRAKRQKAQRDLLKDITPETDVNGNITKNVDLAKVGKDFSGKYGEQLYNSVKDTDEFKNLLDNYHIAEKPKSAADAAAIFTDLAKQQKAQSRLETIQTNQQGWKNAIAALADPNRKDESGNVIGNSGWDETMIKTALMEGKKLDVVGDKNEQDIINKINDLITNGIKLKDKDGKDRTDIKAMGYNESFSQGNLNIAAQNAYETAQSVRANLKDDSPVAQSMDNYLANLKEMLTKMNNGEEVKEVNMNIGSLKDAEKEMIDQLNEDLNSVVKAAGKDIVKAITKVEDATNKGNK